jgi:YggT family protein
MNLSLLRFIDFAVSVFTFIIFIRAIISWVNPNPYHPVVRALDRITEPLLNPIRKALWRFTGNLPVDFSPFIAIILVQLAGRFLREILIRFI